MPIRSAARDVGVQTYSLREFPTPAALCAKLAEIGAPSVELSRVHAAIGDQPRLEALLAAVSGQGVQVVSTGVHTFIGDAAAERQVFDFARQAGAGYISAHFRIDSFREAIKVVSRFSEAYGIKLAVHCHGGYQFGGSLDEIQHLVELGAPYVGVNIDTAWCLQAAGDPVAWIKTLGSAVYGMHYKDFVFDRAGRWSETIIGEGNLDLPGVIHALEDVGFAGFAVIEYESDPQDPAPAIRRSLEKIRALP